MESDKYRIGGGWLEYSRSYSKINSVIENLLITAIPTLFAQNRDYFRMPNFSIISR